ncbi:hypothetical protein ScalyP_jg5565 [Parmales sp. scaly parma]|nr:hypothetical protein ScalyP_jg5565 [Parmales sp. scaly parma]
MQLSNGTIAAEINADQFGLKIENLQVLSNSNTIVAEVVPVCNDKSQKTVHLDFTLQTDNPYSLPMEVAAGTHDASLIKHAVPRKFVPPMLVSCSPRQILYNSIRTWAVQNGTNLLSVLNSTSSESGVLCLGVEGDSVLIKFCSDVEDKFAHNKETGLIENTSGQCVGIEYGGENSTECPKESFPPPNPPCYTSQYTFKVLERRDCKKETQFVSPFWAINEDGFMRSANANQDANDDDEKCMTAPGPMIDNAVAVVARIVNNHEVVMWNVGKDKISIESVGNEVTCNKPVSLKIGVASARNVNGGDEDDYKSSPIELARENSNNGELKDREATNEWWKEFWMSSRVSLGKWSEVESFYYNMLYSFRASNEVGNVSPGLWGPFCTTDTPDWADQMTLDYNFEANYWAAATSNRAELMEPYFATVNSLMKIGEQRASLPDWSEGGYPDLFGGEVAGMACGPTPKGDWDTMYGCEIGFGGFEGVEFSSSMGPFEGMQIYMDDGTRFVAGLAATPYIIHYESTFDRAFWHDQAFPIINAAEKFYFSYKEVETTGSEFRLLAPRSAA